MSKNAPHFDAQGRFIHWGQHPGCKRWGNHGTGVFLLRGKLGTWFCSEHAK